MNLNTKTSYFKDFYTSSSVFIITLCLSFQVMLQKHLTKKQPYDIKINNFIQIVHSNRDIKTLISFDNFEDFMQFYKYVV